MITRYRRAQPRVLPVDEAAPYAALTLRTLIDTLPAGVIVSDARGKIVLANPAANFLVGGLVTGNAYGPVGGYEIQRVDGSPFPPGDLPLPRAIERGEVTRDVMLRVRYTNGDERVLLASGSPVRAPSGVITGAVAVLQDITKRVRTEQALRKSKESLAQAQRIALLGSWAWDVTTGQLTWSDETYCLFGLTVGSIVPSYEAFLSFVYPDDRERVREAVRAAVEENQTYSIEHRIVRAGGAIRVAHSMGQVSFDPSGRPLRMIGTIQDITERKRAEEERDQLLDREQALAQIAQALVHELELPRVVDVVITQTMRVLGADVVGVWLADPSRRALTLLSSRGKAPATVAVLRNLSYEAPSLTARAARTGQTQVVGDLSTIEQELSLTQQVAAQEKMRSVLSIPLESRGRLVGVVTYASRLTRHYTPRELEFHATIADLFAVAIENAHLYEEAREALRLREEFLATAAHELRTPVTVIRGRAQLLLRPGSSAEEIRRGLESIVRHTDQISHLVDDLLAAAVVQPELYGPRRETFDLGTLVREVTNRVAQMAVHQQIHVETNGQLVVDADRDLIGQVVENLLDNAIRYTPEGATIAVTARRQRDHGVISVSYPGPPIPIARQRHAFEPFFELIPAGRPAYVSTTGLELYRSKQIIEGQGGQIWIDSPVGGETSLTFSLSLAPPAQS